MQTDFFAPMRIAIGLIYELHLCYVVNSEWYDSDLWVASSNTMVVSKSPKLTRTRIEFAFKETHCQQIEKDNGVWFFRTDCSTKMQQSCTFTRCPRLRAEGKATIRWPLWRRCLERQISSEWLKWTENVSLISWRPVGWKLSMLQGRRVSVYHGNYLIHTR